MPSCTPKYAEPLKDLFANLHVVAWVSDELAAQGARQDPSDALDEGQQAKAPEEHVRRGRQVFHQELQGREHTVP